MFDIDRKIIEQTYSHCPKWEVCLTGDLKYSCKIREYDGEHLIVEPTENSVIEHCSRKVKVDGIYVCLCPVRKEIHLKYGK